MGRSVRWSFFCVDEGLPLDIEEQPLLADRKVPLAPGDTLLLVTDGVVETLTGDRTFFNMDKLAAILGQDGSGPAQLVEDIFEEMGRISPGPPEDDLTVLAVIRTPQHSGGAIS
jgi:serine phosphatase RsbU (regulator of sigma subunit)